MSTKFEEAQHEHLQQQAFASIQADFPDYFPLLRKGPREIIGTEVMALNGSGKERLRDEADALSWQTGVRTLIENEAASRIEKQKENLSGLFDTVHSSIGLFQNNVDLIPGTKQFDKELADGFAEAAKDYETRAGGKLIGYSVPVQPIINALRTGLVAARAAKAATVAPAAAPAPVQERDDQGRWSAPQAGIPSKAGSSGDGTDDESAGLMEAFMRQSGIVI